MQIGRVDLAREVLVVAEIGNNHEGDFARAEEMIVTAAASGAQAVKFQTIVPERLVSRLQAARIEQLRRYAFSYEQFARLADTARGAGVMFLSTPFDIESVSHLDSLVPAFKIASGDNDFTALLEAVAGTAKPVILSTGMASVADVQRACHTIESVWRMRDVSPGIVPLHCVSAYPVPNEASNLLAIRTLARETGLPVGYSDHTLGIEAAVLAVALGARVIEKHFTLSKTQSDFRDHQLSADPSELTELVRRVKAVLAMLGDGIKAMQPVEEAVAKAARRSVVVQRDLPAGHVLSIGDLDWLRPGGGLRPGQESEVLGRRLRRALAAGEMIAPDSVY
jgi:N,N'-diacetyllegionaminate synthase